MPNDSTSAKKISDNPMDSNWAGTTYTQQMVDSGKYEKREITKPVFLNLKLYSFQIHQPLYPRLRIYFNIIKILFH